MFKNQIEKENFKEVETIIGESVKVKGNFKGKGNIVIEGTVEGSVKTDGNILIGNSAKILANMEAKNAKVGGEVNGNIKINGCLEILASAKIFGDIECLSLFVEKGAKLNGKLSMIKQDEKMQK